MMHPLAASHYLPAQNAVANDFLKLLKEDVMSADGYVDDFYNTIVNYTMECKSKERYTVQKKLPCWLGDLVGSSAPVVSRWL